jgi:hypothetical protein
MDVHIAEKTLTVADEYRQNQIPYPRVPAIVGVSQRSMAIAQYLPLQISS